MSNNRSFFTAKLSRATQPVRPRQNFDRALTYQQPQLARSTVQPVVVRKTEGTAREGEVRRLVSKPESSVAVEAKQANPLVVDAQRLIVYAKNLVEVNNLPTTFYRKLSDTNETEAKVKNAISASSLAGKSFFGYVKGKQGGDPKVRIYNLAEFRSAVSLLKDTLDAIRKDYPVIKGTFTYDDNNALLDTILALEAVLKPLPEGNNFVRSEVFGKGQYINELQAIALNEKTLLVVHPASHVITALVSTNLKPNNIASQYQQPGILSLLNNSQEISVLGGQVRALKSVVRDFKKEISDELGIESPDSKKDAASLTKKTKIRPIKPREDISRLGHLLNKLGEILDKQGLLPDQLREKLADLIKETYTTAVQNKKEKSWIDLEISKLGNIFSDQSASSITVFKKKIGQLVEELDKSKSSHRLDCLLLTFAALKKSVSEKAVKNRTVWEAQKISIIDQVIKYLSKTVSNIGGVPYNGGLVTRKRNEFTIPSEIDDKVKAFINEERKRIYNLNSLSA